MISELDLLGAPEIPGSRCYQCGSTLVRLPIGPFCDWCDMTVDEVLDELGLVDNEHARDLIERLAEDSYQSGHDDGYDTGYDSGYDSGSDECND